MKESKKDEALEKIGRTADLIRYDLRHCGHLLMHQKLCFDLHVFEKSDTRFKVKYGIRDEKLLQDAKKGEYAIAVKRKISFRKGRKILIFDRENKKYETNQIKSNDGGSLILVNELQNDYSTNSVVVVIKKVEYKYFPHQKKLKRKVNNNPFKTLLDDVTEVYVRVFPEHRSFLYRIEIHKTEQMRGYVFLNTVDKKEA